MARLTALVVAILVVAGTHADSASGASGLQRPPGVPFRPRTGTSTSSSSHGVSPAVVASWVSRVPVDGPAALELLVLWRGTPGWHLRGGGGTSSGGGSSNGGRTETFVQRSFYGEIELALEITRDGDAKTFRIQGREVLLQGDNVVLVDDVDGPEGPTVIGTRLIDPEMTAPYQIAEVLRRSPELVSFLRCDARLPDPNIQRMMDILCAQVTP